MSRMEAGRSVVVKEEEGTPSKQRQHTIFVISKWRWPLVSRISEDSLKRLKNSTRDTREHWGTFCKSTSIHGMRYLAEPTKSHIDKVWWMLVVLLGLSMASYYVSRQWVKWNQTAIDANNADDHEPLRRIPASAFTICDNRKLNSSLDESVPSEDKNLMYLICGDDRLEKFNYTEEHLFNLIPPLIMNCTLEWNQPEFPEHWTSRCDSLMTRTLTDQGVCYTINMMMPEEIFVDGVEHGHQSPGRRSDWSMLGGYRGEAPMTDDNYTDAKETGPYPKRGDHAYLLRLYHTNDIDPLYCYGEQDGYRIILHNPDEFPMVGNRENPWVELEKKQKYKYLHLPAYKKALIDVKSKFIYPSDTMSQYSPQQRNCYLPGEKPLSYFRVYSYNNCQLECLTNLTKINCQCVDYYMPRIRMPGEAENITRICSSRDDVICVLHMFDLWDNRRNYCQCLPACTTIERDIVAWYSNRPSDNPKAEEPYEGLLVTEFIIYSTDQQYVKSERRAMYTRVDFIADCGGVFGLFCGMSIISIVELVYYGFLWLFGRIEKSDRKRSFVKTFSRRQSEKADPAKSGNETKSGNEGI